MGLIKRLDSYLLRLRRFSPAQRYCGAVLIVLVVAVGQRLAVAEPAIAPFVIFFLAIAVASSLGGAAPGLVAVVLSGAIANYFFIAPFGAWSLSRDALTATALFFVSAVAVAILCSSLGETLIALRDSERDLSHAQAVAQVGSWRLDVLHNRLLWSAETYRMFGVPKGTPLRYESFLEMVHPEDRGSVDDAWRQALQGAAYDVEHRIVVDGQDRWVHERAELEFDRAGALQGGFGTVQDITERKHAQETLRASEERFRTMFASAGAAIAQLDLGSGRLERVNERFARLTGYSHEELEGMDYMTLIPSGERASAEAALAAARAGQLETGYFTERRYRRKDGGTVEAELYGAIVHDAADRPVDAMLIVIDVTERNSTARQLAAAKVSADAAKAAAEAANQAKDRFLAILSHELRTPLAPVLTGTALLEREALSPDARRLLQMMRRNIELEGRLIDDLLDLTRITRGRVELQRERVDLRTILDRAVEVCRPDIEARRLHFGTDFGPSPCFVFGDAARLQQIFWNLLKNAVKFTPHGGCVGLRCHAASGSAVVEVNDSGVGIAPEAVGTIFDAFSQAEASPTTRQFGGLGLGLTISKSLAEMHGGRIEAASEGVGRGSRFRVVLPLLEPERGDSPPASPQARPPQARPLKVLLVEDHGDTAQTMVAVLELAGHKVATAGDAATALAASEREPFDVMISDLGLPDRSGLDLMRELRARGHAIPAIAVSGYGLESDLAQSRAAGFATHLVKPVDPVRLLDALERLAGEERV